VPHARQSALPAGARGFTLIELLVAVFIAALMFALGDAAMNEALGHHQSIKAKQERLVELQSAVRVLEQDFVQLAPRPVRQPIGDEPSQPALQGNPPGTQPAGPGGTAGTQLATLGSPTGTQFPAQGTASGSVPLVALTRGGWANPRGAQRADLQRVAYYLENGTLRRESWFVLDPTLSSTTARRDILTHVKSVTVQYMDLSHNWQPQWPPLTVSGAQALESSLRIRPLAVQVTLDTEDFGQIVRIFEVAG
jgi:general secretion pathway protein J